MAIFVANQIPNAISVIRIILTPLAVYLILSADESNSLSRWIGACLFTILISTDWIDGYLARKNNWVSNFGKIIDPIADKVLTGAGFICLALLDAMPWWAVIIIVLRELLVTFDRFIRLKNSDVSAAAYLGKVKTFVQAIALIIALFPFAAIFPLVFVPINTVLLLLALLLTIWSGIDYFIAARSKKGK